MASPLETWQPLYELTLPTLILTPFIGAAIGFLLLYTAGDWGNWMALVPYKDAEEKGWTDERLSSLMRPRLFSWQWLASVIAGSYVWVLSSSTAYPALFIYGIAATGVLFLVPTMLRVLKARREAMKEMGVPDNPDGAGET